ncbi:MAG TPA: hypothetical protein VHN20_15300 [Beijerinckiaceae bacterium]|nr:hypothetical protein [Beijerinckiaceae bacterium]
MLTLASGASSKPIDDVVSAFDRALNTVKSSWRSTDESEDGQARRLISDFDGLGGPERDMVAQALTQLWDAFNERFGGLQGFLSAEFSDREAYVTQLERARERMTPYRNGGAAHFYQATALMLAYVRAVLQQQSVESRVLEAVHRGRTLSRERQRSETAQRIRQVTSLAVRAKP